MPHDVSTLQEWEAQRHRSVAEIKRLITACATKDRNKTSFTDNIKNVFGHVFKLGLFGLISLVKRNEDPFTKQEISSNI